MRERGRSRRVALTVAVATYLTGYSTMFERKHSQIVIDDSI